jgi:hypothetical protein
MPISLGSTPQVAQLDDARPRLPAHGLRVLAGGHDQRGRAVHDAARVAGRHGAVLAEGRAQLGQALERRVGLDVVVGVDLAHDLVALLDLDRHDLVGEAARLHGRCAQAVAAVRELVLRAAVDVVFLGQLLGRLRHEQPAVGVVEAAHEHVLQLPLLAEAVAAARAPQHEGRLAQALGAAGHHGLGLVGQDQVRGRDHRLDAAAAQAVHVSAGTGTGMPP